MPRCLHIYDNGFQCIEDTVELTDFCDAHQRVVAFESEVLEDSWSKRAIFRIVAFILLLLFLIPLFSSLKRLYWGPPAEAREAY